MKTATIQRYQKGDRVIIGDLPPEMSHFPTGDAGVRGGRAMTEARHGVSASLVFDDWRGGTEEARAEASIGDFHGGTTFGGQITLTDSQVAELAEAASQGLEPVFWVKVEAKL